MCYKGSTGIYSLKVFFISVLYIFIVCYELFQIWAEPADINVLPEYNKDPRVVTNLLDGVNRTHDDMHLWLAPFTKGASHFIHLVFRHKTEVAMIRIWVSVI